MMALTEDIATIRPKRVPIIGSSSGRATWKNPSSETAMARCHCAWLIAAIGTSSCAPALCTRTWIGPSASSASHASRVAS